MSIKKEQSSKNYDIQSPQTGEGWFYSDTVKKHFLSPKNFWKAGDEKKEWNGMGMIGSAACGDVMRIWLYINPKTEKIKRFKWQTFGSLSARESVLMKNYLSKPVEKLKIGEVILDSDGKENIIENLIKRKYSGKMLRFKLSTSSYYNISVTPNHPLLSVKRDTIAKVQRLSGSRWSEVDAEKVKQASIIVESASNLKKGDFLIYNIPSKENDSTVLTKDICKLLGYYVADGNIPSYNKRVIFYFSLHEQGYVKEIIDIAIKLKIKHKQYKRNTENVLCVELYSKELAETFIKFGGAPGSKNFSQEVLDLPSDKQMIIIDSYLNGDGWISRQREEWTEIYFISTVQENLAYQLQIMLARNEIFAPIHKRPSRKFFVRGKWYANQGEFNVIFKKDRVVGRNSRIKYIEQHKCFLIPINDIVYDEYSDFVYDISLLEDPHAYRVRGISVHNCASAIASTSMLSVMVTEKGGMDIEDALEIKPTDIMERLGGLPQRKIHCSVLGDKALRSAINDYFRRTKQDDRIMAEGAKVIDKVLNVTDKDIEDAVKSGAKTLAEVQEITKVGTGDKLCIAEAEELIRFYREKYQ